MTMSKVPAVWLVSMLVLALAVLAGPTAGARAQSADPSELEVAFTDPRWDGARIPSGEHCSLFGGRGSTPALRVAGVPDGTVAIIVAFNDRDYGPLSSGGGHGKIRFPAEGGDAVELPSVPGGTANLPGGAVVESRARSTGEYASPGYLPPCSGGRGHRYFAVVEALGSDGRVLGRGTIELGRY